MITPAKLIEEDKIWLDNNRNILYVSTRMTPEQSTNLFRIYSYLDGKVHKPTGCGRCLRNAIALTKHRYENYAI